MAGGEKKGLFGTLFKRKEKAEEPKPERRRLRSRRHAVEDGDEADVQQTTPSRPEDGSAPKVASKADGVELELDIPEYEISTVTVPEKDIDVSLFPVEACGDTPAPSAKPPLSGETPLDGTELETIDATAVIKIDSARLGAADTGTEIQDEPTTEPTLDNLRAISEDVRAALASQEDDFEIELDSEEDEPEVSVSQEPAPEPVKASPVEAEPGPRSVADEESEAVTSGEVAMQYGFPEYVTDQKVDSGEAEARTPPGLAEVVRAGSAGEVPRVGPLAIADIPLAGELLSVMTPGMTARGEALAQLVQTCQTPMRIQVRGDAGSGKTSLLHAIEAHLTDRVMPVWLNARDFVGFGESGEVSWLFLEGLLAGLEKRVSSAGGTNFEEAVERCRHYLRLAVQARGLSSVPEPGSLAAQESNSSGVAQAAKALRSELSGLVDSAVEIAEADKLCLFVDDVHRLDGALAAEIVETAYRFLDLDKCVMLAVCDSEALSRGAIEKYPAESGNDGTEYLERIFQMSVNVPAEYEAIWPRLQRLLSMVNFECREKDLQDCVTLQTYSIGPNPRREKLVANRLMLVSTLWPDVCYGTGRAAFTDALNQKLLFGLACLEIAFPKVFRLMLSVLPRESDLALLLQEGLRGREEILSLDRDFSLFPKDADREDQTERLIGFVDCLVDILLTGDRNSRLDAQTIHILSDLIRLLADRPSGEDWIDDDPRVAALTEFCRRVVGRVERRLGEAAPNVFDRRIRMQSSGNAWFSLRYSADGAKAAWGPGRLFYEISFSPANVASVALKCDTARVARLGVRRGAIKKLKNLPLVQQGGFRFKDHGTGLVEVVTILRECSCHSPWDLSEDEVRSVAATLQNLAANTRDMFDLPLPGTTSGTKSTQQPQPQCKVCKNPLERVLLKDGSHAFKCSTCRKIYKPHPKPAK